MVFRVTWHADVVPRNGTQIAHFLYIVHSMHYDIFQLSYCQQLHNSMIDVLFLLFSSYMFQHCCRIQGVHTKISLKCAAVHNVQSTYICFGVNLAVGLKFIYIYNGVVNTMVI
jgi:hypothetical protein